ncbi:MAG: hypothetical protein IKT92_06315 [Bacteroidaceae bacterium]|nr:hypothetical protein [Bacteroidaceae bacterium]
MNTYLSYVNNIYDQDPKRLTLEVLHQLIDAPQTLANLHNYRATGNEDAKKLLPAVMFNGLFSPELADAHTSALLKPGEKSRKRREDPCFVPWPFFGIDIDADDANTLSPCQQLELIKKGVESEFKQNPCEVIAMAYATPSRGSLRIIAKRTKGLTIPEEQECWNKILPIKCDAKCKNLGRLFFLTSREDLLYLNKELLFAQTPYNPDDYPMSTNTPEAESQLQGDYRDSPQLTVDLKLDEDTLENIVSELELCVGGGAANVGDRNDQVFAMAGLMRQLVGPNIPLLQKIIPRYNLSPLEHLQAVTNGAKTKQRANIPANLARAIERATSQKTSTTVSATPPKMPDVLPKAMEVLIHPVPEKTRAAAAVSSFAAWRALMSGVSFHYIDNLNYEPAFFSICCAHQTEGKTATRMPSECILADVIEADRANRDKEDKWREETAGLGANKDRPVAPQLPIRIVEADMTNPAFVKRAVNAQGFSLYTYAEELEKLHRLTGLSEIIRTAYDGGRYGQERVSASSVCQQVEHLRWSFNVSTTPQTARKKFKSEMLNGTLTRLSFSTILSDPDDFGDEMPVYGDFGVGYREQLKPFVELLSKASGVIVCKEAEAWIERERHRQIDALRRKDQRYMLPFMKRSLQMGFWRSMMLYIMNGQEWSAEIEDFAAWSIDYDLWCKLFYFGDLIEQSTGETPDNSRYTTNLVTLLPQEFTREQARNMRRDIGRSTNLKDVRNMLNQWVYRGIVRYDEKRNIYVKFESQKQTA